MIQLTTDRLLIRDPIPGDLPHWHRLISDPDTMYYLPEERTDSFEASKRNLDAAIAQAERTDRTQYFFAIEQAATGAFVGSIGYTVTESTPLGKLVGVGYFILPQYHGLGYTTEALRAVIRFAFEENDVFRISTGCNAENTASERVMQKCGMIKEAEFKSAVWHDGRMKDRVAYRLLRSEWHP